jgi:mRNA interferase RelE/StbE
LAWTIKITRSSAKQLKKLDTNTQKRIISLLKKIERTENPRYQGKALRGEKEGLWRYRIGDYRLICQIKDTVITFLVLAIGHRKDFYK